MLKYFTIQNVPIKLIHSYYMNLKTKIFTIQNVPIKF